MSANMSLSVVNETTAFVSTHPAAHNDVPGATDVTAVQIPDACWEPVDFLDDDENGVPSQLLATLYVNACPMHFEAYLVDENGEICDPRHQESINLMKTALRDDEPWKSFHYAGHDYVMIAIPFGKSR